MSRASRPGRAWIHRSADHLNNFPHSVSGQRPSLRLDQRLLFEHLNKMRLQAGGRGQSSLAGLKEQSGGAFCAITSEGKDQNSGSAVAKISAVERNDQHPMFLRCISEIRCPDFTAPRLRAGGQNQFLEHCLRVRPLTWTLPLAHPAKAVRNILLYRSPGARDFHSARASGRSGRSRQPSCERNRLGSAFPNKKA